MAAAAFLIRRIKQGAAPSVLGIGLLAGFPVGAASAAALYREGRIRKRDAELLAAASSAASPAFLIGSVGRMWEDTHFGWVLFLAGIPTLLVFFLLSRPTHMRRESADPYPPFSLSRDLGDAIGQAGAGCLSVTASVVFFSVLAAVGEKLIPALSPLFRLTFEFSAGAAYGASVGGIAGAAMTGFAVGFSGLAVLTQVSSALSEAGLSSVPYLFSRILLAAVLSAVSALFAWIRPMIPAAEASAASTILSASVLSALPVLLFCLSLLRRGPKNVSSSSCIFGKNLVK